MPSYKSEAFPRRNAGRRRGVEAGGDSAGQDPMAPLEPARTPGAGAELPGDRRGADGARGAVLAGERRQPFSLTVAGQSAAAGLVLCTCRTPDDVPLQLYDLLLQDESGMCRAPHAVGVAGVEEQRFTFCHTSDIHLLAPGLAWPRSVQRARMRALVAEINALRPAFVVHTGDLVSRYGANKAPLPPESSSGGRRRQARSCSVCGPALLTLGNHDVAFPTSQAAWRAYMGGSLGRHRRLCVRLWRLPHCMLLDGFAQYDDRNIGIAQSLTPDQLAWLERDLQGAAAARQRFLLLHYDYQRQLPPLLARLSVDMILDGHSKSSYPAELARHEIVDGHLDGANAYRFVQVGEGAITSQTVSWAELLR